MIGFVFLILFSFVGLFFIFFIFVVLGVLVIGFVYKFMLEIKGCIFEEFEEYFCFWYDKSIFEKLVIEVWLIKFFLFIIGG